MKSMYTRHRTEEWDVAADLARFLVRWIGLWLIWTEIGIGKKFFPFLPQVWLSVTLLDLLLLFIVFRFVYIGLIPGVFRRPKTGE